MQLIYEYIGTKPFRWMCIEMDLTNWQQSDRCVLFVIMFAFEKSFRLNFWEQIFPFVWQMEFTIDKFFSIWLVFHRLNIVVTVTLYRSRLYRIYFRHTCPWNVFVAFKCLLFQFSYLIIVSLISFARKNNIFVIYKWNSSLLNSRSVWSFYTHRKLISKSYAMQKIGS